MKILIANNKEMPNRTVKSYLRKNGYQVLSTNSHHETLEQIEQYHPDVIITDLNISESAFNLINVVKTSQENKQIPIIVISKAGQEHLVETAFDLGANDYVSHHNKLQELSIRINILARCRSKVHA